MKLVLARRTSSIILSLVFTLFSLLSPFGLMGPNTAYASSCAPLASSYNRQYFPMPGGVSLNQAATFLADMTDVTGAYYDPNLDRIVFVGKTNTQAPQFDKDDLAVAIRAVIFNQATPTVGMYWGNNDPNSGFLSVQFTGGVENTNFGNILYQADWKLKDYIMGINSSGQTVTSSVPSYQSYIDRFMAKNPDPNTVYPSSGKVTIEPSYISLKKNDASNAFVFDQTLMHIVVSGLDGAPQIQQDAANQFAQDLTNNYDSYAQETPSWGQTKQLAEIVGVVKWLYDNGIATDFQWAKNYTPRTVTTPTTAPTRTRQVTQNNTIWTFQGGVQYYTPNTYEADDGTASSIKNASQAANSNQESPTWNFTQNGQQYESVAVSADAFRRLGGYSTQAADLATPIAGGNTLALTRSYNSFSTAQNGIGNGWDMLPAKLIDMRPGYYSQCGLTTGQYQGTWPIKLGFQTQSGLYETFSYVCGGTYAADDPAYHSTVTRDSSGFFTVTTKDQRKYRFDPNEYFIRTTDKNGYGISYNYTNLKVSSIVDDNNHTLTLSYNPSGLLSTLSDWAGRTVSYGYDGNGNLTSVTDPRNNVTHYAYDANNNLTTVTDRTNTVTVTNTYNDEHKIATQAKANGPTDTFTYDETNRIITDSDNNGRTNKTYYDDKARTLEQDDPYSNKVFYTYGTEYSPLTVKDKLNHTYTYTYDSNGNTTSVTDPDNKQISYTYDSLNDLKTITDGRYSPSKQTTFTYDSNGNLAQKDEAGNITTYSYTYPGELISETDPLSHSTQWTRDNFGNKLTQTDADGFTTNYAYDSLGRLTSQTDPNSKTKSFTYDSNNNVLTITDGAGTTTNVYNGENAITQSTSPTNAVTQYAYNGAGSQTSTTDAATNVTGYGYDQYQNLTSKQDALTRTTQYAYDQLNRKTQSTAPGNEVTKWTYDANGNIASRTDASNRVTSYQYDALNRLTLTTYPDTSAVTYTYDDRGNMLTMVSAAGTSSYGYDNYDRMTSSTDPHNLTVNYQYDAANNMTQITYPGGKLAKYFYDPANRLQEVNDWNNQSTNYQYNDNGTLASKTLPNGIVATYNYDNANRLTGVTNGKDQQVIAQYTYTRDGNGNVTAETETDAQTPTTNTIIGGNGLSSGWADSSWSSTTNFTDTGSPYSGTYDTAWTINSAWAGLYLTKGTGQGTSSYSALKIALKATSGSPHVGLALHDSAGNDLTSPVDIANYGGNPNTTQYTVYTIPLSVLGGTSTTVYGVSLEDLTGTAQPKMYVGTVQFTTAPASSMTVYDEALAPEWADWSWGSVNNFGDPTSPYVGTHDIQWSNTAGYGGLDLANPSGVSTTGYQTLSVAVKAGAPDQVIYAQLYDANQNPLGTGIDISNYGGVPSPNGYKVYNIPLSVLSGANTTITGVVLQDQTGNAQTTYVDEVKFLPAIATGGTAQNTSYTYDSLGRLLTATYPTKSYTYNYDADGNRTTSNENGTQSSYTVNSDNEITAKASRALTYDAQGNEITDGSKTLAYDFDNRLTSYTSGTQTTTFKYDGAGNRIEKNINGTATYQFVNDLSGNMSRVLMAKNVPANSTTYYLYGAGDLISYGSSSISGRKYYLDDGLNNMRDVYDSTGTKPTAYNYDPYGNRTSSSSSTDFEYKNQETDTETGLYYLRARTYDPTLGAFTSHDPVSGDLKNPQSQNGYDYANDNPINGSDPSGKQFLLTGIGGIFNPINIWNWLVGSGSSSSGCPSGYAPGLGSVREPNWQRIPDNTVTRMQNTQEWFNAHDYKPGPEFDLYYNKTPGPNYGQISYMLKGQNSEPEPTGLTTRMFPEIFP